MKMKSILLAVVMLMLAVSCGSKGKTLVSINGTSITEKDLDFLSTMNPRLKMQLSTPFGKKQILDNMVEQELLYQAAVKKGVQRDSMAKAKIELYKKVIIAQSLVENEMKKAAKDYYDKNKNEFEKLQVAHILVKFAKALKETDKKAPPPKDKVLRSKDAALKIANEIKARLDKGEEFAKVAKESSEDNATKNNGGDLGKASKADQRLERKGYGPLLEKAFTMQVGEIAGPIEAGDGYHIITVTKGAELEPYAEAEQAILMKIGGDERNKLMADLKKNAKIVYADGEKKELAKVPEVKPENAPTAGSAPSPATPPPPPAPETKATPPPAPPAKPAGK